MIRFFSGTTEGKLTLIVSAATFTRLTGRTGYSLLMAQTTRDVTDEDIAAIRDVLDEHCVLKDIREQRQITKMIFAEAFTYAVLGCMAGCAGGLFFSKLIYDNLITPHYVYAVWSVPFAQLGVVILTVIAATGAAVYIPAKRLQNMEITETINAL